LKVFDPLYGPFEIPASVSDLIYIPEVRRLSQIRLLNTLTPSLATLGELRRFSHTLGVLRLALEMPAMRHDSPEVRAFLASILLHDIGTPPFGHLLEYELRDRSEGAWNHEDFIHRILWGMHVPENQGHQPFGGRGLQARSTLQRHGISLELVQGIILGKHPLSRFLFGSLDLDNLDNVARMAWALGIPGGAEVALSLASGLGLTKSGELSLDKQGFSADVERWSWLRRMVYEIIVFDGPTAAAQAVLSEALQIALDKGLLTFDDWDLYDETLLEKLRGFPETKAHITSYYLGRLPHLAFCLQVPGDLAQQGFTSRRCIALVLREILQEVFPARRVFSYVFQDRGAFAKRLEFRDSSGSPWFTTQSSHSTVLYGFVHGRLPLPQAKCRAALDLVEQKLKISGPSRVGAYDEAFGYDEQIALPFSAS